MEQTLATPPSTPQTLNIGSLRLRSRFLLAPLAGYTTLPFRLIVRELGGVGLATTDLVNAKALLVGSKKSLELIDTSPADEPLSIQIYGSKPDEMAEAARWLQEYGAAVIDINMGCPVNKVTRGGGGSALMCSREATIGLVQAVVEAVTIPVTVKMRLGWDDAPWTAPEFARAFENAGVAAVIIHGRTREQAFKGSVNLDGIRAVVDAVESIPVIGNGDVRTLADVERMLGHTGCAGIAIGRGALLNPWIFAQLQHWERTGEPGELAGYPARLELMARHFHLLVGQRGEHFACLTFRKIANWYCKVLRPGRIIQRQLVTIDSIATFENLVHELDERGEPEHWRQHQEQAALAVPKGPISHW